MTAAPNPDREPPAWGGPLTREDYSALLASWIPPELADRAMLRRVDDQEGRDIVGQKGKRDCSGVLFPYYWPGESGPVAYRLRRDSPDFVVGKDGKPKPERKYLGAPGSTNRLYIPPGVLAEQLADATIPVVIVEGEKKALAVRRLADRETETPRFIPIGIAGVWNWRGVVGKTGGPRGERLEVKGPIADLSRIEWKGRTVVVVFDVNVHTNDSVKGARTGIARELATRQAEVKFVNLPEDCGVNGVDDLLAAWGPARVLELFQRSVSGSTLQVVLPPQFQSRTDGMFRVTTKDGQPSQIQLSTYRAAIITNIRLDDGVETSREFEIEAEVNGRNLRFTISASEFARMDWPIEHMGSAAITYPYQRDYVRTAIQSLSVTAEERCIYTHTGWRNADGRWLFLHEGGAICGDGAVPGVNVRLSGSVSRYLLELPDGSDALVAAVRASLRLLELGPPAISFPLLAATFRAVFGEADFSLHLAGETGAFKSEVAALHQQFFGAGMDRLHLPGAWLSTGNALEALAFHTKDVLLVIDDFAPQGNASDVARYHSAADRVFRAAGNHAGRGRLDSTAKLRQSKPPRALILSTGEDIPRGQSVRARLMILELSKGAIKASDLTECQKDAQQGRCTHAMAGFVQWFAGQYEDVRAAFERIVSQYRSRALENAAHARTPDIVANLQGAFELYLDFAVYAGALQATERRRLAIRCWQALSDAAAAQAKHLAATEPTARFLSVLRSVLASGRAHLAGRNGGMPDRDPGSCGWRISGNSTTPLGDCIGWVDGEDVYLESAAAFRQVQLAGRDIGESFPIAEQTLRRRLHEKSLLASVDSGRHTVTIRRSIAGASKDVLHFRRNTILPDDSDDIESREDS